MKKLFHKINVAMLIDEDEELSLHDALWFYGGTAMSILYLIAIVLMTQMK